MKEEIETEKWKIFFKKSTDKLDESYIELIFRIKSDTRSINSLKDEDLEELQQDIEDLGKWRRYKKLKKELDN